jgi:hypothetical protein
VYGQICCWWDTIVQSQPAARSCTNQVQAAHNLMTGHVLRHTARSSTHCIAVNNKTSIPTISSQRQNLHPALQSPDTPHRLQNSHKGAPRLYTEQWWSLVEPFPTDPPTPHSAHVELMEAEVSHKQAKAPKCTTKVIKPLKAPESPTVPRKLSTATLRCL